MLRCEEWEKLSIGVGQPIPSFEVATRIINAWETTTGLDSSAYFDVSPRYIRPKSWFGSVTVGTLALEVVPRSSCRLNSAWMSRFDTNVGLMLDGLTDSSYRDIGDARLSLQGSRYEALVCCFCDAVKRARRQKVIRRYSGQSGTFNYPHGALQFPQQILSQIRNPQQFECSWIELTEDVPENQFIKSVLNSVRKTCSRQCQLVIDVLLVDFEDVSPHSHPMELAQRIRLDRLSGQYASVIELGRQLLEGGGLGVMYGSLDGTSQIVLSPRLFEQYIAQQFKDIARQKDWRCLVQERNTFLCQRADGTGLAEIVPDVRVASQSTGTILVADTKWKFPQCSGLHTSVSREDAAQVLLYAAKYGTCDAALIYPSLDTEAAEFSPYEVLKASFGGGSYRLHVLRVPLLSQNLSAIRPALERLFSGDAFLDESRPPVSD